MILITGANGQLGQALTALCQRRGIACRAYSRQALDICDQALIKACFDLESFDCVINCAAYTAVDAAEDDPQTAFAVNAEGPRILAESGVPVIHVSTDYVFDGKNAAPYGIDAPVNPLSVYGRSKRAGETALLSGGFSGLIVRRHGFTVRKQTAAISTKPSGNSHQTETIYASSTTRSAHRRLSTIWQKHWFRSTNKRHTCSRCGFCTLPTQEAARGMTLPVPSCGISICPATSSP